MAKSTGTVMLFVGLFLTVSLTVLASDPDLTTDVGIDNPNVSDFTFTGFRGLAVSNEGQGKTSTHIAAFDKNLTGLTGLGLTSVLFQFGPCSQISPHTHPRATEIFFVLSGTIDVGFVDTANNLFETTLQQGDLFVFPKGLLHFQRNNQAGTASGISSLSSENPGTLMVANALFASGIGGSGQGFPDIVLATAFGTTDSTIDSIRNAVIAIEQSQQN